VPRSDVARLLRRPGYARFFLVVAASRATGTMFNVAGVLLVLQRTGSLVLAGVTVAAATLPGALTGPFLGAWLDITASRRRLLVLDRLLTIAALVALLLLAGHSPDWVLPLIGIVYGLTSPLSSGAFSSVLPEVAGAELLNVANTFEATSINTAFILGPALAGVIAAAAGPAAALEVQLCAGALLAVLIAGDRTFELRPANAGQAAQRLLAAVAEGTRSLVKIAALRWNVIVGTLYVAGWGTLNVGFPAYAERVHAGTAASGYMWAAISLGSMLSAFAFRERALRLATGSLIAGSFIAMSASVALWPLANGLAGALALIAFTGALEGPSLVALIGVRQSLAPPHLRGQIFTTVSSLNLAAIAIGSALAGPLHAALGTTATLLSFALLMLAAGLLTLVTGAGATVLRREPARRRSD
jgi:MFS family permease